MRSPKLADNSDADIVLLCNDGVELPVYRRILSEASPFFNDMFTLPQCHSTEPPTAPVIEVSETSEVIETLMKLVYPGLDPQLDTLDDISRTLIPAVKYDMIRAVETLRRLLLSPKFVQSEPVRVYAIACRHDLEHEARVASKFTLSITVLDSALSDDLKHITAWSYHRLLDLHRRRSQAAVRVLDTAELDEVRCVQCSTAHYGSLCPPRWWTTFSQRAREELRVRPTSDVVFSMSFLAESAKNGCQRCALSVFESHAFLERLKMRIDDLPSTV